MRMASSMFHPCFGYSLQGGTRKVAIYQIVWNTSWLIICLGLLIRDLYTLAMTTQEAGTSPQNSVLTTADLEHLSNDRIFWLIVMSTVLILSIVHALTLLEGSKEKNYAKCLTWVNFQAYLAAVCYVIIMLLIYWHWTNVSVYAVVPLAFLWMCLVLKLYFLSVVKAFMYEISAAQPEDFEALLPLGGESLHV